MEVLSFVWLGLIILCTILEVSTAQLVSIWFVVGGIAALIASLLGATEWTQILIFLAVTAVSLAATRPLVRKIMTKKKVRTNADRVVGMTAVVTAEIDNDLGQGLVNVEGSIWSARAAEGGVIPVGTSVTVKEIQGVKLLVSQMD